MITITIPLHNEEETLERKIAEIDTYLRTSDYGDDVQIILADNASTDKTAQISSALIKRNVVRTVYFFTDIKGKGNAIRDSWRRYPSNQYWFMDIDLSTKLIHLDELYLGLQTHDIVVGSRLLPASKVTRGVKREISSRGYNCLLKLLFQKRFSDAQCGFKGVTDRVVKTLLPLTRHDGYFFDTELLLLAEVNNYSILELPISWNEGKVSNVKMHEAIPYFLKSMSQHWRRTKLESYSLYTTST